MANCSLCGLLAGDPAKGESGWARAVVDGKQVLICPACRQDDPSWETRAERCPSCDSTRLSKILGDHVCRACGHLWSQEAFTLD